MLTQLLESLLLFKATTLFVLLAFPDARLLLLLAALLLNLLPLLLPALLSLLRLADLLLQAPSLRLLVQYSSLQVGT